MKTRCILGGCLLVGVATSLGAAALSGPEAAARVQAATAKVQADPSPASVAAALAEFRAVADALAGKKGEEAGVRIQALTGMAGLYERDPAGKEEALKALRGAVTTARSALGRGHDTTLAVAQALAQRSPAPLDQRYLVDGYLERFPATDQRLYLPLRQLAWGLHEAGEHEKALGYAEKLRKVVGDDAKTPAWADAVIHLATIRLRYAKDRDPDRDLCAEDMVDLGRAEGLMQRGGFPNVGPPLAEGVRAWGAWQATMLRGWCKGDFAPSGPRGARGPGRQGP